MLAARFLRQLQTIFDPARTLIDPSRGSLLNLESPVLSGGFCESFAGEDIGAPGRLRSSIAAYEYEYESDSDLDDDEDLEGTGSPTRPKLGLPTTIHVLADDPNEVPSAAITEDGFHPITMDVPVRHVVVIPDVAFRTYVQSIRTDVLIRH